MPIVLSRQEGERLLNAVKTMKMRGLHDQLRLGSCVSELTALTVGDIDSARLVINMRQAKGDKDRCVMLSGQLLGILRDNWRQSRPSHRHFPGPIPCPITK